MKLMRVGVLRLLVSSFALLAPIDAGAAPPVRDLCGDTAGPNGRDLRCSCGATVITDAILRHNDPVVRKTCPAAGLTIGPGIALDLNGNTLVGSGNGIGISVPDGERY